MTDIASLPARPRPAVAGVVWSSVFGAIAAGVPPLLAYNRPPSSTLLNQVLADAGWGLWLLFVVGRAVPLNAALRATLPLSAFFALLAAAATWSWVVDALPSSLAASSVGSIAMAWAVMLAGAGCSPARGRALPIGRRPGAAALPFETVFSAFAYGLLVAGIASAAIAAIQVFAPDWADGAWIARSGIPGRAVGNLRQPNHLATLLLWALIALAPLVQSRRLPPWAALPAAIGMTFALVLSASRTGVLGIALLAVWAMVDRRLERRVRIGLLLLPLVYALGWLAMSEWSQLTQHVFGGRVRLAEADLSASRFGIWSNTLAMIRANPWTGVGWGEFNFAWTLTPFPGRPIAFFDHTHNLPLQFAVELGLPLAALALGLAVTALWQAWRRCGAAGHTAGETSAGRAAFVIVAMIGVHSLVEYPLWYAYFLLPAAFAWGCALRPPPPAAGDETPAAARHARAARRPLRTSAWPALAGGLMIAGAAGTAFDYARVSAIFAPPKNAGPLEQRIADGQSSLFFAHHADYAAATGGDDGEVSLDVFDRPAHYLLDTRLMIAWAQALAAHDDLDRARYVAARLREFRNPASADFFAACEVPRTPPEATPFQCETPSGALTWRDFQ